MEPVELLLAVAQAVLFLLVGLVLSERFLLRLDAGMEVGGPERLLFGIVGGVGFAASLMVGNIITGGAVFGLPFFVPIVAALCLLVGWKALRVPRGIQWAPLIVITVALVLLFAVPSMAGGSVIRTGDSPWHLGWSQQLLGGEPIPSGPAAGYGRNAYPWGWHALTATLVRLVPGSTIVTAYSALQLLLLFALPLAGACLSRRLDPAAGWPGAIAMSLVGGFGWVTAQGAAFVATPAHSRFGADLVVASPNSVYELFAPPLPRELGVVLLAATATMMVLALRQGGRTHALAAGVCAGLLGLVSVPLFLSAIVWFAIVSMLGIGKRGQIGFALLPAFVIFLLWAGPVLANYAAYGGFVNITPSLGKEWDLVTALQSWGFLFPLAMIGVWVALKNPSSRPMVAFGIGTAMMLGAASARASFDWTLAGNATLLHQGRVWPVAHLLGAAFAGLAVVHIARAFRKFSAPLAGALLPILLAICVASPALASAKLTELIAAESEGFIYGGTDYNEESFVRQAASRLGPDDIVQVQGSDRLAFALFQYSGVRLSTYDDPRLEGNDLRIRYRDLAAAWDADMQAGGFEPDFLVLPDPDPSRFEPLVTGRFHGELWSLVRAGE